MFSRRHPKDAEAIGTLLHAADRALYAMKEMRPGASSMESMAGLRDGLSIATLNVYYRFHKTEF